MCVVNILGWWICGAISIKAAQQRLEFLAAWFQGLPHGILVQLVNAPAKQSTDQRVTRQSEDHGQPGMAQLPNHRANKGAQANLDRQQIPPKDVSQQPNLLVNLNGWPFDARAN